MTNSDPEGVVKPVPPEGAESQQQLAHELEQIAADQLAQPDEETVVFYDAEHPENETPTIEVDRVKLDFERDIAELRQKVVNAMIDFSQRIALINGEAQGEEHLAIDVQFTKTIRTIRERVIDRVPELANQCWKVSNDAREGELASMERLDRVVADARKVIVDAGVRTAKELEGLTEAVNDDASDQQIDGVVRGADRNLVNGFKYVEAELARVPRYYGEVEGHLNDMVRAYNRLLDAAGKPLTNDEQDEFSRFVRERCDNFVAQLEEKVKLERERVSKITDSLHEYYDEDYRPTLDKSLDDLGRRTRLH